MITSNSIWSRLKIPVTVDEKVGMVDLWGKCSGCHANPLGNYTKYSVQAPIRWTEKWTNVGRVELLNGNNQGLFE